MRQVRGASGRQYLVKTAASGVDYISAVLRETQQRRTRAVFWKIPHKTRPPEISLKLGRYVRERSNELPELEDPKSELTLTGEEFSALVDFIGDHHEPLRSGARSYLVLDEQLTDEQVGALRSLFASPDREQLVRFLVEHEIVSDELRRSLDFHARCRAVAELEAMLSDDLPEADWQRWFEVNDWVLGSEFVRVLDERPVDTAHIADYLMEAYDGFLDLIEIKRPGGHLRFWAAGTDHGNLIPHSDLIKAITQSQRYLFEVEREANSVKFQNRIGVPTVKPRCTLIYSRSNGWMAAENEAYRILNSGLHDLTVLTYDHVLRRAKRMLGLDVNAPAVVQPAAARNL